MSIYKGTTLVAGVGNKEDKSGGHEIEDLTNKFPQRDILKFNGADVEDSTESTNIVTPGIKEFSVFDKQINNVSADLLPVGSIVMFAGINPEDGWLICDGRSLKVYEYPELFNVIEYIYGGEGDDFNIPDYRDYVPVGVSETDTNIDSLGKTFGAKTHTLTVAQMPSHNHRAKYTVFVNSRKEIDGVTPGAAFTPQGFGRTGDILNNAGGGQAHNNMQPSIATNFIIKTKQKVIPTGDVESLIRRIEYLEKHALIYEEG